MKIRIDGRTYDTTKAERIATYDDGLPRMNPRIESERCNDTQRQHSGNSGGLDMSQSANSTLAADSKS